MGKAKYGERNFRENNYRGSVGCFYKRCEFVFQCSQGMKEGNGWDSIILVIDRIQDGSMNTGQKKKILAGGFQSGFFSFVSGKLWVLFLGDG